MNILDEVDEDYINVLDINIPNLDITPGMQSSQSGLIAMNSIELAIELACVNFTQAMVTAPISKEAVNLAGYSIPGHTEFLAEKTETGSVLMMLMSDSLRIALATVHIPVSKIAESISETLILEKLKILYKSLKEDFLIESPKIAVLGLNPPYRREWSDWDQKKRK